MGKLWAVVSGTHPPPPTPTPPPPSLPVTLPVGQPSRRQHHHHHHQHHHHHSSASPRNIPDPSPQIVRSSESRRAGTTAATSTVSLTSNGHRGCSGTPALGLLLASSRAPGLLVHPEMQRRTECASLPFTSSHGQERSRRLTLT